MNIYRKMYRHMGIHVKIYMHTYGVILRTFQYIWRTCFCMYSYVHTSEIFVSDMNVFICLYKQIWCAHVLHIFVHTCVWGTHILHEYMHTWIYTYLKIIYLYILIPIHISDIHVRTYIYMIQTYLVYKCLVCSHTYVYICIYARIWYEHTHAYIFTYLKYTYLYVHMYIYDTHISGVHIFCMYTYIRVYLHVHTYLIRIHSYIHIHVSEVHVFECTHTYIWGGYEE